MTRGWQILMVVVALAACGDNKIPAQPDATIDADVHAAQVDRGRYIMNNVGVCSFCHTPLNADGTRDQTRAFSGVECLIDINPDFVDPPDPNDGFGCLSSRNLTNDATGLASRTDAQIKDAFLNGHRTDGKSLVPVMPYYIFHNMTDDDADSIVAYMRTIPPVNHVIPVNEPPWNMINDGDVVSTPVDMSTVPLPSGGADNASGMRGRYLAAQVGLCVDCHTPGTIPTMDDPFGLYPTPIDTTMAFSGGRVFSSAQLGLLTPPYPPAIYSRNITPDQTTGIGNYTVTDIENAIAKGKDINGNAVCAGTHGSGISSYAALAQQDLDDIATYIHDIPPITNAMAYPNCQGPPVP